MFKVSFAFDDQELLDKINAAGRDADVMMQKYVTWYLNQVYGALAKQHGRKWSYTTPPGDRRKNVYLRSGKLRQDLSDSRFVRKTGDGEFEAGFDIRPGSYLNVHVGERGDPPTIIGALGSSSLFLGRMTIPLRAALNSNGTAKVMTPRVFDQILILPFHVLMEGGYKKGKNPQKGKKPINNRKMLNAFKKGQLKVDFSGEDLGKFHPNSLIVMKQSGRRLIPLFVLAKQIKIPKRIFIGEKMEDYYDALWNKLNDAVEALI